VGGKKGDNGCGLVDGNHRGDSGEGNPEPPADHRRKGIDESPGGVQNRPGQGRGHNGPKKFSVGWFGFHDPFSTPGESQMQSKKAHTRQFYPAGLDSAIGLFGLKEKGIFLLPAN